MNCIHCKKIIDGEAIVSNDNAWHRTCIEPYRRIQKGLLHECPKCNTTGKMNDPKGTTKTIEVPLGYKEMPICAYDDCRGCRYCRDLLKSIYVPVEVVCNLCNGEGWLTQKPVPISKVVDWKLP